MYPLFLLTVIGYFIAWISVQATATPTGNRATLHFAAPLPRSVEIFITSPCPSVTKWMIQYRKHGDNTSTQSLETIPAMIQAVRVEKLIPNTAYEFRIRASEVNGDRTVTEIEYPYPHWEPSNVITTDSLSIFGKVTLPNLLFTAAYRRKDSLEWSKTLTVIQQAYQNRFNVREEEITLLRIENSPTNNPTVHYKVKVPDASLPSRRDYAISGPGLSGCVINNGDTAMGKINIRILERNGDKKYNLWYSRGSCPGGFRDPIVERYMIVSPEDSESMSIHLNVASSDATSSSEPDGILVQKTGELRLDSWAVYTKVSRGIFIGLTPKFLVKDCLRGSSASVVYSEVYGPTVFGTGYEKEHFWDKTQYPDRTVNATKMSCSSGVYGESLICDIPTAQGGYKYEILKGKTQDILGSAAITDINCSEPTQVVIKNLTSNVTYELGLRVAIRNSDGTQRTATSPTRILAKTAEYIPDTTIPETTVLPSTTARVIDATTIIAFSTNPSTTAPSTVPTTSVDTETTVFAIATSIVTKSMSTKTITSMPTQKPGTSSTTAGPTSTSGNDCVSSTFRCSMFYKNRIWILLAVTGACIVIFAVIFVLCVRASRRRKKYCLQSQI